jgi:hypothetical protein
MKTKEITLDWTADLLPMWEEPCCTDEICNCVKPITLKTTKRPTKRKQINWGQK